ncbi:ammonium transporter [Wenyingzhuangia fucanilytica]|uniref:Ammonium transporter n=1 Tax=Wenyingzhuangia fucanilytica TaxID=1790137 RepID=A0A1B1Y3S3_9FLAO|nr:ammonium transporter [Wenyingzhuangia fucanilytica]ANW95432.1 ammonium transporter [Wenyingzhuangia fucanilytica]
METTLNFTINNLWMMVSIALVFIMHLGFSTLEVGLARSKNAINILFKNFMIVAIGLLTFAICGFNLMYPGGDFSVFNFAGFGISLPENGLTPDYNGSFTYWTDFLFQGMFAATAATIVSGAVAERIKLGSFLVFSLLYVGVVYPIIGSWGWGGGFLSQLGFHDFAGSTFVHSVGGWAAVVAVILLGPRLGKYLSDGSIKPIVGHNIPLAALGVFLLWFGWFGFNGGSVLSADAGTVSLVLVTTSLAASAGIIAAFATSYIKFKTYDITMAFNGALAGLVGITAGADLMSPLDAIIIGFISGVIIVFAVGFIDRLKMDDPVGAIGVHLICGTFGTLAVGIWGDKGVFNTGSFSQLGSQAYGVMVVGITCLITSYIILFAIKKTMGLRVSEIEEKQGLDIHEHGMNAYEDINLNDNE